MSEEVKQAEETPIPQPEHPTTATAAPEQKTLSLDDLKMGYVVGITPTGDFIFELFGKERGLVELLGLHAHAGLRVNKIHAQNQASGDMLVNEVGKAVALLHQKVDQIVNKVAPKTPDNKIITP